MKKNSRMLVGFIGVVIIMSMTNSAMAEEKYCGTFYGDANFRGGSLRVCKEIYNLEGYLWNDKISSFQIDPDTWCVLTKDGSLGGDYIWVLPKDDGSTMEEGWNDKVSAIQCAHKSLFSTEGMMSGTIQIFEHNFFAGDVSSLNIRQQERFPQLGGWNDRISSLKVAKGAKCFFYEDANFQGQVLTCDSGDGFVNLTDVFPDWNDRISSIECQLE